MNLNIYLIVIFNNSLMRTILLIATLCFSVLSFGQMSAEVGSRQKVIYGNLVGADGFVGLHYDMRFMPNRSDGPGFAVGIGGAAAFLFFTSTTVRTIPVEVNYVIGLGNNSLLLGIGVVHMKYRSELILIPETKTVESQSSPLLHIAYRHKPIASGFFFQAGLEITSFDEDLPNPIPISVGFGYAFK